MTNDQPTQPLTDDDLAAIERTLVLVAPLAETHPEVLDNIDHDAVLRHVAEVAGTPSTILRSAEEVARIRAARNQAREQQAQMETVGQVAEAAKNAAPVLKVLQGGVQGEKTT